MWSSLAPMQTPPPWSPAIRRDVHSDKHHHSSHARLLYCHGPQVQLDSHWSLYTYSESFFSHNWNIYILQIFYAFLMYIEFGISKWLDEHVMINGLIHQVITWLPHDSHMTRLTHSSQYTLERCSSLVSGAHPGTIWQGGYISAVLASQGSLRTRYAGNWIPLSQGWVGLICNYSNGKVKRRKDFKQFHFLD